MPAKEVVTPPVTSWRHRRRIVYATLIFSAAIVTYLVFMAPSDPLREQIALGLIGLAGATIGSYVFGSVWDDRNNRSRHRDRPEPEDQ